MSTGGGAPHTNSIAPSIDTNVGSGSGLNVERGNPLLHLFTPPPQWPTAQTLWPEQPKMPEAGETNPLKGLFTPQPQYMTPQALPNPEGHPPDGEVNHLKGFFTPENQWATPQTELNPEERPHHYVPERQVLWGTPEEREALIREHNRNTYGSEVPPLEVQPKAPQAVAQNKQANARGNARAGAKTAAGSQGQAGAQKDAQGKVAGNVGAITAAQPSTLGVVPGQKPLVNGKPELSPVDKAAQQELRGALDQLKGGRYQDSVNACDQVLQLRPENAQAHYIKAVALVNLRQFKEAANQYNEVMRLAQPGDKLMDLARVGLAKISN
jgi:hypothetical protein